VAFLTGIRRPPCGGGFVRWPRRWRRPRLIWRTPRSESPRRSCASPPIVRTARRTCWLSPRTPVGVPRRPRRCARVATAWRRAVSADDPADARRLPVSAGEGAFRLVRGLRPWRPPVRVGPCAGAERPTAIWVLSCEDIAGRCRPMAARSVPVPYGADPGLLLPAWVGPGGDLLVARVPPCRAEWWGQGTLFRIAPRRAVWLPLAGREEIATVPPALSSSPSGVGVPAEPGRRRHPGRNQLGNRLWRSRLFRSWADLCGSVGCGRGRASVGQSRWMVPLSVRSYPSSVVISLLTAAVASVVISGRAAPRASPGKTIPNAPR